MRPRDPPSVDEIRIEYKRDKAKQRDSMSTPDGDEP